ncbi:MAG: hypothetical protein LBS49_10460 [Candidatus Accumulibacter sp.]|nr:hypothetical protein [Accumulibacter sp.]
MKVIQVFSVSKAPRLSGKGEIEYQPWEDEKGAFYVEFLKNDVSKKDAPGKKGAFPKRRLFPVDEYVKSGIKSRGYVLSCDENTNNFSIDAKSICRDKDIVGFLEAVINHFCTEVLPAQRSPHRLSNTHGLGELANPSIEKTVQMKRERLINSESYPEHILERLAESEDLSISIANRWMLGWPKRVETLLETIDYWPALMQQTELEAELIAEAEHLNLSPWEVKDLAGIDPAPPVSSE